MTLEEHAMLRDWAVRFGVAIGLLAGAGLSAAWGWIAPVIAGVFSLLVGIAGVARHAWTDATRRSLGSSESAGGEP